MQLDIASLKPRICAISKRDLAETTSPNDYVYCVLYQTARFCLGKRLSKRALCLIKFFKDLFLGLTPLPSSLGLWALNQC